jgi:hypothetical protein
MLKIKNTKAETRITETINGVTRGSTIIHDRDLYEKELFARIKKINKALAEER